MGVILEIVLNNFAIAGKNFFVSFSSNRIHAKAGDDFSNLISKSHGLTAGILRSGRI
jgi:hypothetical protein